MSRRTLAPARELIEGKPLLVVIDTWKSVLAPIGGERREARAGDSVVVPAPLEPVVVAARKHAVPIVFVKDSSHQSLVGWHDVWSEAPEARRAAVAEIAIQPDDHLIRKPRYSVFYGTELEILALALGVRTLLLGGGMTDVCVRCSFVDAHQHDYFCRVVEDCMVGSSPEAHESALLAMEYMQTGASRRSAQVIEALIAWAHQSAVATAAALSSPR